MRKGKKSRGRERERGGKEKGLLNVSQKRGEESDERNKGGGRKENEKKAP